MRLCWCSFIRICRRVIIKGLIGPWSRIKGFFRLSGVRVMGYSSHVWRVCGMGWVFNIDYYYLIYIYLNIKRQRYVCISNLYITFKNYNNFYNKKWVNSTTTNQNNQAKADRCSSTQSKTSVN